jgi:CRP/FNR family transcriptional regulator
MTVPTIDILYLRVVSEVEFFRHLEREDLVALLGAATKSVFKAGEVVYEEGDDGQSMYVVVKGRFDVYRHHAGRRVTLATVEPGEHFGEIALIASRQRSATVVARVDSVALRLTKEAVFGHPRIAAQLLRNMARMLAVRLTDADDEILLHRSKEQAQSEEQAQAAPEAPARGNGFGPRRGPVRRMAG